MDLSRWLPFTSTVIALAFAGAVWLRYRRARGCIYSCGGWG